MKTPIPMTDPADYIEFSEAEAILSQTNNPRDRIIIGLLWRCGLRAFEVGRIRIKHLLFDENVIIIDGKGGHQLRMPIEPELMAWIKEYTACNTNPEAWLLPGYKGKGVTKKTVWRTVKKYSSMSGITVTKANKAMHPHAFRHSLAIWLVKSGVSIEKISMILRHSSLVPTTYYLKFSIKELTEDYLLAWQNAKQPVKYSNPVVSDGDII